MSILADFQKGQQMVIGREAATTANLANRLTREGLRREEKSRAANEDLAYLSNDVTGIYRIDTTDDVVRYTLREDWKEQVKQYHSGPDNRLKFDQMAGHYYSKGIQSGEIVKKKNQFHFGPTETKVGTVPSSLAAALEAKPGDPALLALKKEYEDGIRTAYIVPVVNREGMFSFLTRNATDEADDEELIFSEDEVEAYLSTMLISGLELEKDPDANRYRSAVSQGVIPGPRGVLDTSMERAKALFDEDAPRDVKLGILQMITNEYNANKPPKAPGADTPEKVGTSAAGAGANVVAGAVAGATRDLGPAPDALVFEELESLDALPGILGNPSSGGMLLGTGTVTTTNSFKAWFQQNLANYIDFDDPKDQYGRPVRKENGRPVVPTIGIFSEEDKAKILKDYQTHLTQKKEASDNYETMKRNRMIPGPAGLGVAAINAVTGAGLNNVAADTNEGQATDPVEMTLQELMPELFGISDEELMTRVDGFLKDGTFLDRGFSEPQVNAIRQHLEALEVQNMQDLKDKVDEGVIKNPYKYALTLSLTLANDKGLLPDGTTIKDSTDRMFNYLTTDSPTMTPGTMIDKDVSIASAQTNRLNFRQSQVEYLNSLAQDEREAFQTRANNIVSNINSILDSDDYATVIGYLADPYIKKDGKSTGEIDINSRSVYQRYEKQLKSGMTDFYNLYKNNTSMVEMAQKNWTDAGFDLDQFTPEVFYMMAGEAGLVTRYNEVVGVLDDIAIFNAYNQLVESNILGAIWPGGAITMKDWLGDFPAGNTPDNPTQYFENLMAVRTDSDGAPIELVIKRGNATQRTDGERAEGPWGKIEEGEASIRFDYLIRNNILPPEHLYRLLERTPTIQ